MKSFLTIMFSAVTLRFGLAPETALACAACSGKSNDALVGGLNAGIFTLLVVLLSVLTLFVMVFVRFIWLQAKHADLSGLPGNPHHYRGIST